MSNKFVAIQYRGTHAAYV